MSHVVVISAHPDDLEIGMGGTVAKLVDGGSAVTSIILTDGRRCPNPLSLSEEQIISQRKLEATRAADVLGIREIIFGDLMELNDEANRAKAVQLLAEIFTRTRADAIFTLHPELDRHPTHRAAGKLTLSSLRQTDLRSGQIWAYEVWGLFSNWDRYEDISNYIGKKLQAIAEHVSQVAVIPYSEGIAGLNRWRGAFADPQQTTAKSIFAEVFQRLEA